MKSLVLSLSIILAGCNPAYTAYSNMHSAFYAGCDSKTISSSINTEGDSITLKATCTKDK